jgi:hypothetical protein
MDMQTGGFDTAAGVMDREVKRNDILEADTKRQLARKTTAGRRFLAAANSETTQKYKKQIEYYAGSLRVTRMLRM